MPRGDKSAYTDKQKRQAQHIEERYEERDVDQDEAEKIAWATVNKETGGGKKSGSGRRSSVPKDGKLNGAASAGRTAEQRSASAKKAAATRKRNAEAQKKQTSGGPVGTIAGLNGWRCSRAAAFRLSRSEQA